MSDVFVVWRSYYDSGELVAVTSDELVARRLVRYVGDGGSYTRTPVLGAANPMPPVRRTYLCRISWRGQFTRVEYELLRPHPREPKPWTRVDRDFGVPVVRAWGYPTPQAAQEAAQAAWATRDLPQETR